MDRLPPRRREEVGRYSQEHLAIVPSDGSAAPTLVKAALDLDRGVSAPSLERRRQIDHLTGDRRHVRLRRANPDQRRQRRAALRKARRPGTAPSCRRMRRSHFRRRHQTQRNVRLRKRRTPPAHASERRADGRDRMGQNRRGQLQEQGRHRSPRPADLPGRLRSTAPRFRFLLRIHGGPNGQDAHSLSVEAPVVRRQRLRRAARELSRQRRPRLASIQKAISADWGHYEVEDLRSRRRSRHQNGRRRSRQAWASAAGATAAS